MSAEKHMDKTVTASQSKSDGAVPQKSGSSATVRTSKKTPAFQAMHSARYRRQEIIRTIETQTGRQLICYVGGIQTSISRDDVLMLVDLLHNLRPNENVDLLLHTPGGDMDAAEKLISMVRHVVANAELRVVIPDFAKSSGTLMALGADYIVMSDSSELGPIDPQIVLNDGQGNRIATPIQSYLDAYAQYSAVLATNPNDVVAHIMMQKLDPARIKIFEAARNRARTFAENQLRNGMFRTPRTGNITGIAGELLNTGKWLSHGQMIGHTEAKQLGLSVEYLAPDDDLWQNYWQLYCYQRLAIKDKEKLFESNYASLPMEDGA
jgi:ATP-dependent protease ClpP protease subunit